MRKLEHVFRKTMAVVLSAAMVATSFAGIGKTASAEETAAAYEDTGSDVFDNISAGEIAEVLSPGWNLGNQLEAVTTKKEGVDWYVYPDETGYGNPVITKELFESVRAAGFKSVRIPVSYFDYIGTAEEDYTVNEDWMARIKEVVDMALAEDLYVCINMHGDGYNSIKNGWLLCNAPEEKQAEIKAKYGAVWTQVAEMFADYDEHLIFESMNEEFDGETYDLPKIKKEWYDNINAYNQIFVDSVRQVSESNAKRWLLVCGWNTNIDATVGDYGFVMPEDTHRDASVDENRIMVSVHYYEPWGYAGGEDGNTTQWGSFTTNAKTTAATAENAMANAFNKLRDKFTSNGIPVIVGEYGAIDKTEHDEDSNIYREYFNKKLNENAVRVGAIPMYWDNGHNGKYGFGLFNRKSETKEVTQQSIIDAIMSVYNNNVESDATNIALDKETLEITTEERGQLTTTLTMEDGSTVESFEGVKWTCSDETIAVVSTNGAIKGFDAGEVDITATLPNGKSAVCKVTVKRPAGVECKFYASNTVSWSVSSSNSVYLESGVAKSYTATLDMSRESLCNIGAFYLKDINIEGGLADVSDIAVCNINVTEFTINGVSIPLVYNTNVNALTEDNVIDMAIINKWFGEDQHEMIEGIGEEGDSRSFEGYEGVTLDETSNTVIVKFETIGSEAPDTEPTPSAPAATATVVPATNAPATTPAILPTEAPAAAEGEKVTVGKTEYTVSSAADKTVAISANSDKKATKVTVPATVTINGEEYKVTTISKDAYKNNKKLKSVVIGKNVKVIEKNAFNGCKNLKKIDVKSTVLKKVGKNAFKGIHKKATITVPKKKFKAYKKLLSKKGQAKTVKIKKK